MINTIAQIFLIAGPQAALGIIFCLLITNNFDLINFDEITGKMKFSSKALLRFCIPTFNFAFLSIVLRHLRFDLWVAPLVMFISTFTLLLVVYRIKRRTDAIKLFIGMSLYYVIEGAIETAVTPLFIHINELTIYDVFDSFYLNFMSSIPSLIIIFIIDMFLFIKKKNYLNISVVKSIIKSRILIVATLLLFFINIILITLYSMFINDGIFRACPVKMQIFINTILMTFPALNLGGLWFLLYSVKYKEAIDMRIERDEMIREVSVANERSRLARDVHDTLGHSLTVIIKLLEVCKVTAKTDHDKINGQLEEAIKIAQNGVQEIKHSVSGILAEKILTRDFLSLLMELASEFENKSGITVNVTVQGTVEEVDKKHAAVLYSVCQEALTNSLRHGNAKNIAIVIKYESETIKLTIFDDGVGCRKIQKGFGLNGMEQRISEVNGKMSYKSEKGQGFILNFEIPKDKAMIYSI